MKQSNCPRCDKLAFCFDGLCNECYRELNPPKPEEPQTDSNFRNRMTIELDPEEYRDKVKDHCFRCGGSIPGTIDHYMQHGNACDDSVLCKSRRTLRNDGYLNDIRILV